MSTRLSVLLSRKYIGRNYDGTYKIQGKPAEYFLLNDGIAALKRHMPDKCDARALHNLYKDKTAKASTITHGLEIFTVYYCLKKQYGERILFFTKNQLYPFHYFPDKKPDAFIRLEVNGSWKEYFLEVKHPVSDLSKYVRKVKRYIEYSKENTWAENAGTSLPKVLFVFHTVGSEISFQRQAARFLKKHYAEEPQMFTSTVAKISKIASGYDRIWRNVEEPLRTIALHDL